jgi:drug/metabolite transporter (DMT)-like permease
VLIMSWPKDQASSLAEGGWQPILLGLASGAVFGISAIGYRGGILALEHPNFVVAATTTLSVGLIMQTAVLTAYLWLFDRERLMDIFRAWRPSVLAGFMGAFASQMWFLAFAIETAAKVRTLALVEIFFAQIVSRSMFKQGVASREGLGIALIVAGVIILLNV